MLGPITIGDNVTICANAVMVSDAPPNTVWAGVPAREIGTNISKTRKLTKAQKDVLNALQVFVVCLLGFLQKRFSQDLMLNHWLHLV